MSTHLEFLEPFTQEPLGRVPYDDEQVLAEKVAKARVAQQAWRRLSLEGRIVVVRQGLERLQALADEVTRDVSRQMGKPITQARRELETLFDRAEQSIADAPAALAADVLPQKPGFVRRIEHEPHGVVLNIAAWNYPLIIPINVIVPALLAGNVVLLKHSAKTPLTGLAFERAFGDLDVPHLVTHIVARHEVLGPFIASGAVEYVAFTGSVSGGREVYRQAAEALLDAGLELGGKDPAYVAADADLAFAAENIVDAACYNAGQSCCAVERVYVHRDVHDEFVERAAHFVRQYRLGDPLDEATTMGPLATVAATETLERQVHDAIRRGAQLIIGGHRGWQGNDAFFAPTLLTQCPQDAPVMQEESFGPLVPVLAVDSDDDALRLMNDSRYGLTASVWTQDSDRAEHFARELRAGTVFQNRADYLDPALAWTGWGESGVGSTLSRFGFYGLTRRKSIHFRQ